MSGIITDYECIGIYHENNKLRPNEFYHESGITLNIPKDSDLRTVISILIEDNKQVSFDEGMEKGKEIIRNGFKTLLNL